MQIPIVRVDDVEHWNPSALTSSQLGSNLLFLPSVMDYRLHTFYNQIKSSNTKCTIFANSPMRYRSKLRATFRGKAYQLWHQKNWNSPRVLCLENMMRNVKHLDLIPGHQSFLIVIVIISYYMNFDALKSSFGVVAVTPPRPHVHR